MEMLATSAIGEDDAHGAALRAKLQNLKERRAKRKGLILMSIEYFRLIDEVRNYLLNYILFRLVTKLIKLIHFHSCFIAVI